MTKSMIELVGPASRPRSDLIGYGGGVKILRQGEPRLGEGFSQFGEKSDDPPGREAGG